MFHRSCDNWLNRNFVYRRDADQKDAGNAIDPVQHIFKDALPYLMLVHQIDSGLATQTRLTVVKIDI